MRKLLSATVLALVAMGSEAASAQSPVSFKPSVFGSVALPTGDTGNGLNTGFTAGAGLDIGGLMMPLSLRAEAAYTRFALKDDGLGDTGNASDASGRINAVFALPSIGISPYVIGGIGMYHLMSTFDSQTAPTSNQMGWNVGAGVDVPLGAIPARIEARYHSVSLPGGNGRYTYMPITFGIRF